LEKEILQKDENGGVPEDAVFGVSYTSICIDVPKYLAWLYRTVTALGANIIKTTLDSSNGLGGIVTDAKQILLQATGTSSNASGGDIFALINCTGLSARHFLPKLEAEKLYPIRGQTLLVKGECKLARTYTHFPLDAQVNEDELTYVIPRPGSGTAILGGCKQAGNWDANVDEGLSERILERVRRWGLAEELMKRDGGFEVLSTQVGFRPGRKGGPRVEVEMRDGEEGKIEGVWVVHAYGHAGGGYQASVGSAEKVVRLLEGLP
jgi:D-amino-acid oxidase